MTATKETAELTVPHPGTFDTKREFRPGIFAALLGLHLGALWVFVFKILPWIIPRFLPGLERAFTSNPLTTLDAMFTNKIFMLSFAFFVGTVMGITVCFHRGETHTAFKWANHLIARIIRIIFLALGHMALEGDLVKWAERHRPHHDFTDRKADSHTPMRYSKLNQRGERVPTARGFLYAHVLTYCYKHLLPPPKCPDTNEARAAAWATSQEERHEIWVGDLEADPVIRKLKLAMPGLITLRFLIPFLVAGWDGALIAGLFTAVFILNVTWCTNSVAHMWGRFQIDEKSRKIAGSSRNVFFWIFQWLLSLGEAWHYAHHRLQTCAAHGWRWFQFDFSKYIIGILQGLGIVVDVKWLRSARKIILASGPLVTHGPPESQP